MNYRDRSVTSRIRKDSRAFVVPADSLRAKFSRQKPRLGFLGLGWIGLQRMAAIAAAEGAEIVALADPVQELVARAAELAPKAAQMRTLEELLRNEMDGVVIATPSALHASQAVTVLNRGTAVFCQKPLGRDLEEASYAVEAAKAANRLLGVDLCRAECSNSGRFLWHRRRGCYGKQGRLLSGFFCGKIHRDLASFTLRTTG